MPVRRQGNNPNAVIPDIGNSSPNTGFYRDVPIPYTEWTVAATGLALGAHASGDTPGVLLMDVGAATMYGVAWEQTGAVVSDATAVMYTTSLPGDYHGGPCTDAEIDDGDELELHMLVRFGDTQTLDSAVTAVLTHLSRGAAAATAETARSVTIDNATGSTADTYASFLHIVFRWKDIGLEPHAIIELAVVPVADIDDGTPFEIGAAWLRYNSTLALWDDTARGTAYLGQGLNAIDLIDAS